MGGRGWTGQRPHDWREDHVVSSLGFPFIYCSALGWVPEKPATRTSNGHRLKKPQTRKSLLSLAKGLGKGTPERELVKGSSPRSAARTPAGSLICEQW